MRCLDGIVIVLNQTSYTTASHFLFAEFKAKIAIAYDL